MGWVNIDLWDAKAHPERDGAAPQPDLIADIRALPHKDASVDRIYMGHVLEHLPYEEVPVALAEVYRVLKPGGYAAVVGPDIEFAHAHHPEAVPDIENGGHRWEGDAHHWHPTVALMEAVLKTQSWDFAQVDLEWLDAEGWPLTSLIGWQHGFVIWK